ncbi:MAG: hypothetical protein WC600_15750 [Desulfobaccales bacterium]
MSYHRTISDLVRSFIIPEINKRIETLKIDPKDLPIEINQFRILQPAQKSITVIELNEEVRLICEVKLKREKGINELITLDDIYPETCNFMTSQIYEGEKAAFFYYKSLYFNFFLAFDCTPNIPEKYNIDDKPSAIPFPLLDFINNKRFFEKIKPIEKLVFLSYNNWPPAPGYYPYILLNLPENPEAIDNDKILDLISEHYNKEYFKRKIKQWEELGFFSKRIQYIKRAIDAHFQNDFICSIFVIVPQFEGIIKDYLMECNVSIPNSFINCVIKLKSLVLSRKLILFPIEIFKTIFDYIETGSFWKSTNNISDQSEMVNRHGIAHGLFTGFECKAISLKYLILMDTLSFMLLHDKILTGAL